VPTSGAFTKALTRQPGELVDDEVIAAVSPDLLAVALSP
jgi:hypothetical protein